MHRRFIAVAVAVLAGVLALGLAPASAAPAAPPSNFYLALGDSLAAGYQPGVGDNKTGGYVGPTATRERALWGPTTLVNDACSGETTGSMINGGLCTYTEGSQLNAAVAFLNAHTGHVGLITLDIGANNVDSCIVNGVIDFACVQQGITKLQTDLPMIYGALRTAAPTSQIIVANYYDPFLAAWLQGAPGDRAAGESVAKASVSLLHSINLIIAGNSAAFGIQVADVMTAYQTDNFTKVSTPYGRIPTNVAKICQLTYMCTLANIHPNDQGYTVIARAVTPIVAGPLPV